MRKLIVGILLALSAAAAQAMSPALSTTQRATLKTACLADAVVCGPAAAAGDDNAVAGWFNATATPDFWVWRTSLTEAEITQATSVDGTTWNWTGTGYITRSQGERDAWARLFATGTANPSLANTRQAFSDILSGSTAPAPANRTHMLAMARRKATVAEKLLATGTGTTASPAVMAAEGAVTTNEMAAMLRN